MKFVVKWGIYKQQHEDVLNFIPDNKIKEFDSYEDAKRFKSLIISDCIRLGTSFYTKPIIEVEE